MDLGSRCALVLGTLPPSDLQGAPPDAPDWRFVETPAIETADTLLSDNRAIKVGIWVYGTGTSGQHHFAKFTTLRARHRLVQWLAVVPRAAVEDRAVAAHIAQHFVDYLTAPVDLKRLYLAAGHADGMARLMERTAGDTDGIGEDQQMVGTSEAMRDLFRLIRKVAASDAPVFISGETGTGKELAARAIHERSSRRSGPFVAVDCGAIAPTLIQSELFGYEKGAFTGAGNRKAGRIEAAEGGTLFLDEIGDLPMDLQGNLLRFLQESSIQRIGSTQSITVNARVIAATNVKLDEAVKQGRFREDLFYRLNVLRIATPPLRDRGGDVEVLARYFLARFARESGKPVRGYASQAIDLIRRHAWPGNIRELINRVRRALVMAEGQWITAQDLDLRTAVAAPASDPIQLDAAREAAEREAVRKAIKLAGNNHSAAARILAVSRPTFYRLLEKHRQASTPILPAE